MDLHRYQTHVIFFALLLCFGALWLHRYQTAMGFVFIHGNVLEPPWIYNRYQTYPLVNLKKTSFGTGFAQVPNITLTKMHASSVLEPYGCTGVKHIHMIEICNEKE